MAISAVQPSSTTVPPVSYRASHDRSPQRTPVKLLRPPMENPPPRLLRPLLPLPNRASRIESFWTP